MTRGHDGPYLGAHVADSIEHANTVLPNPPYDFRQGYLLTMLPVGTEWGATTG